jgi:hypothetical protein
MHRLWPIGIAAAGRRFNGDRCPIHAAHCFSHHIRVDNRASSALDSIIVRRPAREDPDGTSVIEEMVHYAAPKPSRPSDHKVVAVLGHDEGPPTLSWASRAKSRLPDPQVATKVKRAIFQPSTPVTRSTS